MTENQDSTSTRPYLIRALYEWCTDNGFTPYVAVLVDDTVRVPNEYVKDGEIVLNISFDATSSLKLGNEFIEFRARFAGSAREIMVPIDRVIAIYARENGQGMAFPMSVQNSSLTESGVTLASVAAAAKSPSTQGGDTVVPFTTVQSESDSDPSEPPPPKPGPRPVLTRVK